MKPVYSQSFLERLRAKQKGTGKQNATDDLALQACSAGPLIVGPSKSWREDARWLEQNCEEFRVDGGRYDRATRSTDRSSIDMKPSLSPIDTEPANETPAVGPQPLQSAPESPQSASEALPIPLPIPEVPLLASGFWQALLCGSRESIICSGDANVALRLVARQLGTDSDLAEFTESIRIHSLRQALTRRFGAAAWRVMNELWRSAPATPGASAPNENQNGGSPGARLDSRQVPQWIGDLHDPDRIEVERQRDLGIGRC
jgi:hypothetical protein